MANSVDPAKRKRNRDVLRMLRSGLRAIERRRDGGTPPRREVVSFDEVASRDRWTCWLCRQPVSRTAPKTTPNGGTMDHLTPLSKGGAHTARNLRLAHQRCNSARGSATGDDLTIVLLRLRAPEPR